MSLATGNADLVRRGYEAFNEGDLATLTEIFAENCSWHSPGSTSMAGDRHGRDAVFALFGRYGGETNGTFQAALREVLTGDGGSVVGVHRNTGERDGKQLDTSCSIVFEVRDGKIQSGREHVADLGNWDAFWA